jgi:hypothetical protein
VSQAAGWLAQLLRRKNSVAPAPAATAAISKGGGSKANTSKRSENEKRSVGAEAKVEEVSVKVTGLRGLGVAKWILRDVGASLQIQARACSLRRLRP